MRNIKVIYIGGVGRSGSTILDRILGTIDGVSSCAEIYRIWEDGFVANQLCSCWKGVDECEFFAPLIREVIGERNKYQRVIELQESVDHSRHFFKLYTGLSSPTFQSNVAELKDLLEKLYFTLAKASGCDILVDSSKLPSRAFLLSQIPGIEVHLVHIVRDVRALAYAWQKDKYNPAIGRNMTKHPARRIAIVWWVFNVLLEFLSSMLPYRRIRYEDFAVNPRVETQKLIEALGPVSGKKAAFLDERTVQLGPIHTIGGNPHRFFHGTTEIRFDTEWVTKLDANTRRLVTLLTYPLLIRYGYTAWSRLSRVPAIGVSAFPR